MLYYCGYVGCSCFQLAEAFMGKVSRSLQLPNGEERKEGKKKDRKKSRREEERKWECEGREEGKKRTNVKAK